MAGGRGPKRHGGSMSGPGGAKRGRGRAEPRGARFQGQRLDENNQVEEVDGMPNELPETEEDPEEEGSDEDEGPVRPTRTPYLALLESFAAESSGPRTNKRRKLAHAEHRDRRNGTKARGASANPGKDEGDGPAGAEREEGEDGQGNDVDHVDEEEEDPQVEPDTEKGGQDSDDDDEDQTDPFDSHFSHPDDEAVTNRVRAIEKDGWESKRLASSSFRIGASVPKGIEWPGTDVLGRASDLDDLKIKERLRGSSSHKLSSLDDLQRQLAPLMFGYHDILFCDRTVRNADSLRKLTCLHILNHIFKTRDRIIKNSYKLAKDGEANPDLELRDQGFTRPKVLYLLPTRSACVRVVNTLRDLSRPGQQENRKRFDDSFGAAADPDRFGADKPADFLDLFGGNDDDMFRLGVKFTRKTLKYYAQFYNSDILFASPLGLRVAIGSDGEKNKKRKLDFDFLSSIELVVLDQADAMLMQNWEHVEFIFEHLNGQPRDSHGCDFSRVRSWYLENQARYFRQTIVTSAFHTPELSELSRLHCHNWAGKLRIQPPSYPGMIQQLGIKARQTFSRFDPISPAADPDARFAYFTTAVLPSLTRRGAADAAGTLIFVPSYLDFVRLRNFFATSPSVSSLSFGVLSEYADVPGASRARSHFATGRHKLMLYTERAHHFRRYKIKGTRRVLFYALPDNPLFYGEIAGGFLSAGEADGSVEIGRGQVRAVFSKYDVLKLERVVGSERVGRMISDRGDTFGFV